MKLFDWLRGRPARSLSPQEFLRRAQQKSPPVPVPNVTGDLGARCYEQLAPRFPGDVRNLFETGKVAIGEVGILTPNAFAEYVPPSGYAIQVYTGLSRFLDRVSRAMHTRVRLFTEAPGKPPQEPSISVDQTMEILSAIFHNFMRDGKIAGPSDFAISQGQIEIASLLASHAENFVVAHEVGHIVVWLRRGGKPGDLSPEEEFQADKHALVFILGAAGTAAAMNGISRRMAYAGAEFALRVHASLEHLGYKFISTHPLPGVRLQKLREMCKSICGGHRGFMQVSTIAFSYDQLLEDMERKIAGETAAARFVIGVTPERLLSSLSVLIEELIKEHVTAEFVVSELTSLFSGIPEAIVRETARQAATMYFVEIPESANVRDVVFALQEGETFKKIASRMPEPFQRILNETIQAVTNSPPTHRTNPGGV